ncbi:MAG: pyridoxal-phosphate dependent enzyme [Actinomycetota bacterium]|nr:pyridoxal-phosphate dependent enzyme [Actinomycetota bacterium]MDQ3733394.1 pyridoxal-phosphate dependent enzyme [Actinomycetota bacterium]
MTLIDELHSGLAAVGRVALAQLPTPLHLAPRLSEELGIPVWLKRDDLTGIGLGGNKVRALEYLLADALADDCDCLVTGAGAQSNWTMLAALTAARYGLDPYVVCYGDCAADRGNLLLHRQIGTTISFTGDPERSSVDRAMDELATELRDRGRRPYVVPRGGATSIGALGYVRASFELSAQLAALTDPPTALWLAAGSGGTCAGLVAGAALRATSCAIVGVTVSRPVDDITAQVRRLAAGALDMVGGAFAHEVRQHAAAGGGVSSPQVGKPAIAVDIRDGWIGPGYGLASSEGDRAAALLARTEMVFLDPVFGAKAMAALIDGARSGEVTEPAAFLVSGGAPTLFTGPAAR